MEFEEKSKGRISLDTIPLQFCQRKIIFIIFPND